MNRDIRFTQIFMSVLDVQKAFSGSGSDLSETQTEIKIKVEDFDKGQVYTWTREKFSDKLAMMRDACEHY